MRVCGILVRSTDSVLGFFELTLHSADDAMKASACFTEAPPDLATSHSEDSSDAPCLRLFKAKNYYEILRAPGSEY